MVINGRMALAVMAALLVARAAAAQSEPTNTAALDTERWDVVASASRTSRPDLPAATFGIEQLLFADWRGNALPRFYVGYYWTAHLKTDARVMLPVRLSASYFGEFEVPGLPDGGYRSTDSTMDINSIGFGVTYQFRENTFVHPYVSSGLQLERRQEHRFRDEEVHVGYVGPYPSTPVRYTVPALDERTDSTLARPYVGAGAKVYFNARLFTRVEALVGVTRTLEAGVGLDF